jgi:hypothetical protein
MLLLSILCPAQCDVASVCYFLAYCVRHSVTHCTAMCVQQSVHSNVCTAMCAQQSVHSNVCPAMSAQQCVHSNVCPVICAHQSAPCQHSVSTVSALSQHRVSTQHRFSTQYSNIGIALNFMHRAFVIGCVMTQKSAVLLFIGWFVEDYGIKLIPIY